VHIVVVDQSRTVLKAVTRLLESDGHSVSGFVEGRAALDFIKTNPDVSAVITSAELGTISGLELCWEIRLLAGRDRAIYIILMSSNDEPRHLINALDSGADEFIRKPPATEELYARLRSAERQLSMQRDLIRLAMLDPLTGVLNRRAFFEAVEKIFAAAPATGCTAAIMFDVDHFKKINDTHGHDVGDQVLRTIGREIAGDNVTVGRLGGEEFAILLSPADLEAAVEHGERLRAKLAALPFTTSSGDISITCSFGVAEWQAGETIDQLLKRADAALYRAKHSGRNRVIAAAPDEPAADVQGSGVVRSGKRTAPTRSNAPQAVAIHNDLLAAWSSKVEAAMSRSPECSGGQSHTYRAFVLDDEAQIGALVCKVLEACGLSPRQFTSPAPFLSQLREAPPELVVLDLSLGQSDAVEVIRHLERAKYRGKVLLISGRDEPTLNEIAQIGQKHGLLMLPPLQKPFRPRDVKERLSTHLPHIVRAGQAVAKPAASAPRGEIQIAEALRQNWLELWYQAKIDLKAGQICGAEALVRARHPFYGIITPDALLPPPGDPDYQPLTHFVIDRAMSDWTRFARQGLRLRLSVNAPVSVIQMPGFISHVRSALPQFPEFCGLIIEVTEDEVIRDSEWAHEVASQLKLYNIHLSIDDFGSGYASLSRLNDLPFAEVKIDRSFVFGCGSNPLKYSLCQTVVDLAHRFGATACAEGVENAEDLRAVMGMQCDSAQGYLLATPIPAAEFCEASYAGGLRAVRAILHATDGHVESFNPAA